jgi:hypothetical protein
MNNLLRKLRKIGNLGTVLPSLHKLRQHKQEVDRCLNLWDPQKTEHGVDLDPSLLFESLIEVYNLQNSERIVVCLTLDGRPLKRGLVVLSLQSN